MKKILFIALFAISTVASAQSKGTIKGLILDKDMNNEPLAFASIVLKGTTTGTETDMDGKFSLSVKPGTYTVVFSFLGYKDIEKKVTVAAGQTVVINESMSADAGVQLEEVKIKTTTTKEKESALLLEQKKATVIKESIGAQRLTKIGVSDAGTATTKISGVTKSEGSGNIFIRGLGDRYLSTTMNGLPIPSDDVENKNIDLGLFSTNVIQNVGISKTYTTGGYADQASGNVDVVTKLYSKKGFTLGLRTGTNTNIGNVTGDFRRTVTSNDVTLGFHKKKYALKDQILQQGWDTETMSTPVNFGISFAGAAKFKLFNKDFRMIVTGSHSQNFRYQQEIFRSFRSNVLDNAFPDIADQANLDRDADDDTTDVESFQSRTNTTGYFNLESRLNDNHKIKYNTLFVNKSEDNLYEFGRKGFGYVFDQDPQEEGAFVRDQNFRQTTLFVNQLVGEHRTSENNKIKWAAGYNFVLAEEPNRVRNELNILDITQSQEIQYAHVGDFQQRKSSQKIEDTEYNAFVENSWSFGKKDEDENKPYKLNVGANFRNKERSFKSLFIGVRSKSFRASSVDNLSSTFTDSNFSFNTTFNASLTLRERPFDTYDAKLTIFGAYANLDFTLGERISGNVGARFEKDQITSNWDVANFNNPATGLPRIGDLTRDYTDVYPSLNLKYEFNEKNFLRFAFSKTQTLPEFKELSPFEYVSPNGRVTKGNPNLERSDILNFDLKWEFFPNNGELVSATAFYKQINNPINIAMQRGSSGNFQFFNTGEQANVYGLELEGRVDLIKNEDEQGILNVTSNITQMFFSQDLFENFRYKGITASDLQGASDFIVNGSLSYNNRKEKEFVATVTANYSSDKVFALGSPEDFANSATLYNDEIIEKGFVTLDMVLSKKLSNKISLRLVGRNLLNPNIRQTQLVRSLITGVETNETVVSYKKGSQLTLSLNYRF